MTLGDPPAAPDAPIAIPHTPIPGATGLPVLGGGSFPPIDR